MHDIAIMVWIILLMHFIEDLKQTPLGTILNGIFVQKVNG